MVMLKKARETWPKPCCTTSAQQQISYKTIAEPKRTVGHVRNTGAQASVLYRQETRLVHLNSESFRSRTAYRAALGSGDCVFQPLGTSGGS